MTAVSQRVLHVNHEACGADLFCFSLGTTILSALRRSGEQKRDFIYVGDLLALMDKLILVRGNLALKNHVFEIGTGESIPIKNFVIEIKHQLKSSSMLDFGALPTRKNEIMESKADLKKLNNILSWHPKVDIKQGISKLI